MATTTTNRSTLQALHDCILECEKTIHHMIVMNGKEEGSACPLCCQECRDICRLTEMSLVREGDWSHRFAGMCAEVCDWCAVECDKMEHEQCKKCAESCRRCAEACRRVAAAA